MTDNIKLTRAQRWLLRHIFFYGPGIESTGRSRRYCFLKFTRKPEVPWHRFSLKTVTLLVDNGLVEKRLSASGNGATEYTVTQKGLQLT
jgi:hypothetical protein